MQKARVSTLLLSVSEKKKKERKKLCMPVYFGNVMVGCLWLAGAHGQEGLLFSLCAYLHFLNFKPSACMTY